MSFERVMPYPKGTIHHGNTYGTDSTLRGYTDVDWASDVPAMSYKFPSSAASNFLESFYDNLLVETRSFSEAAGKARELPPPIDQLGSPSFLPKTIRPQTTPRFPWWYRKR